MSSRDVQDALDNITVSERGRVRVLWIKADNLQGLVDRIAIALEEHLGEGDDLHITSNALTSGWEERTPGGGRPSLLRRARRRRGTWTQLNFEYSALVVVRAPAGG